MKVTFQRWMIDKKGRRPISVEPSRVDIIEHYQDGYRVGDVIDGVTVQSTDIWWGEQGHNEVPAASRIVMFNKQEYLVQGSVEEITKAINEGRLQERPGGTVHLRIQDETGNPQ